MVALLVVACGETPQPPAADTGGPADVRDVDEADTGDCGSCDADDGGDVPDIGPDVPLPRCGDGLPGPDEACDDGNDRNDDACLTDCTEASCGDGNVQIGVEECDDGNRDWDDGCLRDCRIATCGDGWIRTGVEACDRTLPDGVSCASRGFPSGEPTCTDACEIDYGSCERHLGSWHYGGDLLDDFSQQLLDIAVTPAGGHVVAGRFQGAFLLDDRGFRSPDARSVAVVRLTRSGRVLWGQSVADARQPYNAEQLFGAVAVGADESTVLVGAAEDWVRFAPGEDPREVSAETDFFVVKYAEDGSVVWDRLFGGFGRQRAEAVAIASDGTIYVAGRFTGVLDLGPDRLTSQTVFDLYVAALSPDGDPLWGRNVAGAYQPRVVATPHGVVFTGYYEDTVDLGGERPLESRWQRTFVAELAGDDGRTLWQTEIEEEGNLGPTSLTAFPDGDLLVGGSFTGARRERGFFAARLRGAEILWHRVYGSSGQRVVALASIAPTPDGGIAVAGHFDTDLDLPGAPLTGLGGIDIFAARLDGDGAPVWTQALGNPFDQFVTDMAVDAEGNLRLVGTFEGAVDLGGGTLHSNGRLDSYVLHLFGGGVPGSEE